MQKSNKKTFSTIKKKKISNKTSIEIFSGDFRNEIIIEKYFVDYYGEIFFKCDFTESINVELILKKLFKKYKLNETAFIYKESMYSNDAEMNSPYSMLIIEVMAKIWIQIRYGSVKMFYGREIEFSIINDIIKIIKDCEEIEELKGSFYMVVYESDTGFDLKDFKLKPKVVDLSLNYNDNFLPIHQIISETLMGEVKNGLVLLHGKYGSGKTSYLRYLINSLNKRIIFLPLELMDKIASPDFLPFISEYKNSILVVEDCEELLRPRETSTAKSSGIINLLNLGDGLLADALSIKIICTFNTDLKNIDQAILRKGRLIARYEFQELNTEKAQALSNSLGFKSIISEPMTLADIYNQEKKSFSELHDGKKMGFKIS